MAVPDNAILEKRQLASDVYWMKIHAPLIARERKPGQFIILQLNHDFGERIPLTIADADAQAGYIVVIFQAVGKTTQLLAKLEAGDSIANLVGPLGRPTHIERFGTVVFIGGGIGVAPLFPIAQGMQQAGNRVIVIMGARTGALLILKQEMGAIADELIICTDDGSAGRHALVSIPLKEVCERNPQPDLAVIIGPPIMMKVCSETTRPYGVRTWVSLNTIMVDGTGMCGGCRVTVGGATKFVCVDGPEFDGHQVDFNNMMKRLKAYQQQENEAREQCRLEAEIERKGSRP